MLELALITLVRSTLLAELPAGVDVLQKQNPVAVGVPSNPTIYIEVVIPGQRIGWLSRKDRQTLAPDLRHEELQWLETTLQVSALAPRREGQPTASDYAAMAAQILQGDAGLRALAVQRVRPLRVTTSRTIHFINDAQQYEANPSFDIVLCHVQIRESVTPPLTAIEGAAASI